METKRTESTLSAAPADKKWETEKETGISEQGGSGERRVMNLWFAADLPFNRINQTL